MSTITIAPASSYEFQTIIFEDHGSKKTQPPSRPRNSTSLISFQTALEQDDEATSPALELPSVRSARANLVILQLCLINFLTSVTSGLMVTGLPRIAADLALPQQLYLWPSSVFGLTCGSSLLLAGAIADVLGPRTVDLFGCFLLGIFTLACGVSRTGIELVVFRALQGIGSAIHRPCSVALISQYVPSGKQRNMGFACLGLSMPLGFSVGLVVGGILVDSIGWRFGYYITSAITFVQVAAGFKIMPPDVKVPNVLARLKSDIDWIGAFLASTGLAVFSYVLAILSSDSDNMKKPSSIIMLVISVALMVAFPFWMRFQERRGRPGLVPNYLWKSLPFSTICALCVLTWGVQESMELFSSL